MKKLIILAVIALAAYACSDNNSSKKEGVVSASDEKNPSYDPNRGAGKFTKVELGASLDKTRADGGKKVFDLKCSSCHKLTEEKLVGPGWKGVTTRHTPEWIMNFATNTDEMLNKDPKAQALIEICLVRMPNQNLTDDDARNVLEFMRGNDGVK
jgi:cytochrome c551/c552